jgi:uncharacterized protein YlxP (DUF503 family)
MFVGIARIEYHVPGARSLKAKRHVLRKLIDRTRAKFKITVNEVDHQDLWQRTALGVAVVGGDGAHVERMLSQVMQYLDDQHLAEPLGRTTEIIAFGDPQDDYVPYDDLDDPRGGNDG